MAVGIPDADTAVADESEVWLPPLETEGVIGVLDVVSMAFASLRANPTRSLLTTLGVIIGVASVVTLLALGTGASAEITAQVRAIGTNVLTVFPGGRASQGPGGSVAAFLTMDDYQAIVALRLPVVGVAPQFSASAPVVAPAADKTAQIVGSTASYLVVNGLTLASGTFFDDGQVRGAMPVVVLGATLATDLFGSGQAVGQTVRVKGQPLRVIGVLAPKGGSSFGSVDDRAFIPISAAQQRLFGARTPDGNSYLVSSITIAATNEPELSGIQQQISALLRERHHLKADGSEDDFIVFNQASLLSALSTVTTLLTIFLAAVAGISLLVGGIGIMNIMLVSVTERTREIGLRMSVGARGSDILLQFLVEALVISLMGGLIGLALGAALAVAATLSGLLPAVVSPGSALIALGFATAVGLFFGIFPARRAAQLDPIEALRFE